MKAKVPSPTDPQTDNPTEYAQYADRTREVVLVTTHNSAPTDNNTAATKASFNRWHELDSTKRNAVYIIVRDCLLHMIEHPDDWIPYSLTEPKEDESLTLNMSINFVVIDQEELAQRIEPERELHSIRTGLLGLHRSLSDKAQDLDGSN